MHDAHDAPLSNEGRLSASSVVATSLCTARWVAAKLRAGFPRNLLKWVHRMVLRMVLCQRVHVALCAQLSRRPAAVAQRWQPWRGRGPSARDACAHRRAFRPIVGAAAGTVAEIEMWPLFPFASMLLLQLLLLQLLLLQLLLLQLLLLQLLLLLT